MTERMLLTICAVGFQMREECGADGHCSLHKTTSYKDYHQALKKSLVEDKSQLSWRILFPTPLNVSLLLLQLSHVS